MYRKIYRQEGGLAEEGYRAQLRQAREKAIEDWNRRTRGEVAERVRDRPRRVHRPVNIPLDTEGGGLATLPEARSLKYGVGDQTTGDPITLRDLNPTLPISKYLLNMPEIARLEVDRGGGATGPASDARHQAASHEMRKSISNLLQKANLNLLPREYTDLLGNLTTNAIGGGKEFLSFLWNIKPFDDVSAREAWDMGVEDLRANWEGTFGIPTGEDMTPEQIFEKVYKEPEKVKGPNFWDKVGQYLSGSPRGTVGGTPQTDEGGLADLPEAQAVERPKSEYYTRWTPEELTGPFWSAGQSYGTPEDWSKSPKMVPPGLFAENRIFMDRVKWERDWRNQKIAEIQAKNYSPEREAELIGKEKRQIELIEDLTNRQTSDFNTQRNWAYGQLGLPVPTQPTGFAGTGYGQFSPQPAGGVYTPTGDPGLRPAAPIQQGQPMTPIQQAPIPPIQQAPTLAGPRQPVMPSTPIPPIQTQEQALETGPFINQPSTLGPYPIGMPVTPGGPAIGAIPAIPAGLKVMRRNPETGNYEPYTLPNTGRIIQ